jgi:uncharacterized protein (TIGR04255 family)
MSLGNPAPVRSGSLRRGERRVYSRPPVLEALIDIKTRFDSPPELAKLGSFEQGEEERYPERKTLLSGALRVDPQANVVMEASQTVNGFRFSDGSNSRIAQVRTDGFAYSRLAPYSQWEEWIPEAERLWKRYVESFAPSSVWRIAVRYVNRVDLHPDRGDRLRDFLRVRPELPEEASGDIAGFIMRLELPQPQLENGMLILSIGRVQSSEEGTVSILLDLDVFQVADFDPKSESMWEALNRLHEVENSYFESFITERAREAFA